MLPKVETFSNIISVASLIPEIQGIFFNIRSTPVNTCRNRPHLRSHLSKCYDLTSNRLHTYTLYRDTHKGWDCIKTTQNSRIMSIWSLSFGFCNSNEYFDGLLKSHPFWVTLYNYIFYNSALCLKHSYFSFHFKFMKLFLFVSKYWLKFTETGTIG